MLWNREGYSRNCFLVGRFAFKFPKLSSWEHFLRGLLSNLQERRLSKLGWPDLCPVVFSIPGGFLLVMERAIPLTRDEWDHFDAEAFVNAREIPLPVELKMNSFGRLKDRIVAIDYGGH